MRTTHVSRRRTSFLFLLAAAPALGQISVTSVSPDYAWAIEPPMKPHQGLVELTISGGALFPGMMVTMTKAGQPDITPAGTVTFINSTTLKATFNFASAAPGPWDIRLTHPLFGTATQTNVLTVRPTPRIRKLGAWGGSVQAMDVREEILGGELRQIGYVARGSGMVVLDVTDPANMTEIGSLDLDSARGVFDIAVSGNYAYVCDAYPNYITIVDVSDPAQPSLVVRGLTTDSTPLSPAVNPATDVLIAGDTAYFLLRDRVSNHGEIRTLDISAPASFVPPAFQSFGQPMTAPGMRTTGVWAMTMQGNQLVVLADNEPALPPEWSSLFLFDVSSAPASPSFLGRAPLFVHPQNFNAVAADGDFAFVAMDLNTNNPQTSWLMIVNISQPTAPFLTGIDFDSISQGTGIAASSGVVYVADYDSGLPPQAEAPSGLVSVDVSNPIAPGTLGAYVTHGSAWGVTLVGTTAFLLDRGEGIIALDVSDPANPVRVGHWHSPAFLHRIDKENDTLYLSDWWNGITALDVSEPRSPVHLGNYQTNTTAQFRGDIEHVRVRDGIAYLAAGFRFLEVVDFTDPDSPVLIDSFQPPQPPDPPGEAVRSHSLALTDDALVVSAGDGWGNPEGLWVFDLSDPVDPILASTISANCLPFEDWSVSRGSLAIGLNQHGWIALDVADPMNPITRQFLCGNGLPSGHYVAATDTQLYTAYWDTCGNGAVRLWNLGPDPDLAITLQAEFDTNQPLGIGLASELVYFHSAAGLGCEGTSNPLLPNTAGQAGIVAADPTTLAPVAIASFPLVSQSSFGGTLLADDEQLYLGWNAVNPADDLATRGLGIYQSAAPGDGDADFDRDLADYADFQRHFGGAAVEPVEAVGLIHDFDQDDDVDLDDWYAFALALDPAGIVWATCDPAAFASYASGQGLTQTGFEDFSEMNLPPNCVEPMDGNAGPLTSQTNNGVFQPGDIAEGLAIWYGAEDTVFSNLNAYTAPFDDLPSNVVLSDHTGTGTFDVLSIQYAFTSATAARAVAMDVVALRLSPGMNDSTYVPIEVFDTDDKLMRRFIVSADHNGRFLGFWSAKPIGRIRMLSVTNPAYRVGADNLQMWTAP